MARKSSKEAILDAVERVICQQGLANTTMEAVAAEAGVSKGGLFYHFSGKKDMLLQLMDRFEARFKEQRNRIEAGLPDTPARRLKATLLASIDHPARRTGKSTSNIMALLGDADLKSKIAGVKKRLFQSLCENSLFPEKIALALLVMDGMWVSEMFDESIVTEKFKKKIFAELLAMVEEFDRAVGAANAKGVVAKEGA